MFVVATPTTAADLRLGHELSEFARVEGEISVDLADSDTCASRLEVFLIKYACLCCFRGLANWLGGLI